MEHIEMLPEKLEELLIKAEEDAKKIKEILKEAKITRKEYTAIDIDEVYHDINHIHYLMEFPE